MKLKIATILAFCLLTAAPAQAMGAKTDDIPPIQVLEEHAACQSDEECTDVMTHCSYCECLGEPVNRQFEEQYKKQFDEQCRDYSGPVCEMDCPYVRPVCINNRCQYPRQ